MLNFSITPSWLTRFEIQRASGSPITGAADFDIAKVESDLNAELSERQRLEANKRFASDGIKAKTWLRVASYQLIQMLYAAGREDELLDRIETHKRLRTGTPDPHRDLFKDGLVGLFARYPGIIAENDRNRMVLPMWHGFRHYIPPSLLAGFNIQYPAHKRRVGGWKSRIEPALVGWVIEQRAYSLARECNLDPHRGVYPGPVATVVNDMIETISEGYPDPSVPSTTHASDDLDWD